MILTGRTFPQRITGQFDCMTRIVIQVRGGGGTIFIAKEMGEISNPNDGVQLTLTTTNPPWTTKWRGDMWYQSDTDGQPFVLLIVGKEYD